MIRDINKEGRIFGEFRGYDYERSTVIDISILNLIIHIYKKGFSSYHIGLLLIQEKKLVLFFSTLHSNFVLVLTLLWYILYSKEKYKVSSNGTDFRMKFLLLRKSISL